MERFNDTSNSYLVIVPTFSTNSGPQNGNEHWGTNPTCMHSHGFSVIEENTCLTLCIATGENVQNLQAVFLIQWTRIVWKLKTIFKNIFININKNCPQDISESVTMSPCHGVSAIGVDSKSYWKNATPRNLFKKSVSLPFPVWVFC